MGKTLIFSGKREGQLVDHPKPMEEYCMAENFDIKRSHNAKRMHRLYAEIARIKEENRMMHEAEKEMKLDDKDGWRLTE